MEKKRSLLFTFFIFLLSHFLLPLQSQAMEVNLPAHLENASVELHAHLFMKEGMGWLFSGHFNEPLHAQSWKNSFSSQANPLTLDLSGIGILVVALYAHPLLTWNLRESIRSQIDLAEDFVKNHDGWTIARTPQEAKKSLEAGQRVLVLSLEGASGILETEEDLDEFIEERGIRIVAPLHLMDDSYGGVAFLKGFRSFTTPISRVIQFFRKTKDAEGIPINPYGLTNRGRQLVHSLLERNVWIDLAHSSDHAQKEMIPLLRQAGQPLLYTHTVLRSQHPAERALSNPQLTAIKESGGIIGLVPSSLLLNGTKSQHLQCQSTQCQKSCQRGFHAFIQHYQEATRILPLEAVFLGSDFNGAIPGLPPNGGCKTHTALDQGGFWNIAQNSELWRAVKKAGVDAPDPLSLQIESFLGRWSKVF
jgi:microsomal dipeptidase-like Zn-dependent dipeptidase